MSSLEDLPMPPMMRMGGVQEPGYDRLLQQEKHLHNLLKAVSNEMKKLNKERTHLEEMEAIYLAKLSQEKLEEGQREMDNLMARAVGGSGSGHVKREVIQEEVSDPLALEIPIERTLNMEEDEDYIFQPTSDPLEVGSHDEPL